MSELLRQFFTLLTPAAVTDIFLLLMLCVFGASLLLRLLGKAHEFVANSPSLMTSLGILGTFFGIIIGLYDFRIEQIDSSIATLLEGLKTAFITSVFGIASALVLRALTQYFRYPADRQAEAVSLTDINNSIKSLSVTLRVNQEQQDKQQQQLIDSVTQQLSQGIVLQLQQLVEDFNQRVESQFGDNLARFGDNLGEFHQVIDRLSAQAGQHEERIQYWTEHCDATVMSLLKVGNDFKTIGQHSEQLPELMQQMEALTRSSREQVEQLNTQLGQYAGFADGLRDFVPQFSEKLDRFSQGMELVQQIMDTDLQASLNAINRQSELLEQQIGSVSAAFSNMSELDADFIHSLVQQTATTHRDAMQELAVQQARTHLEMSESLAEVIRRSFSNAELSISKQYELMEHRMEKEVDEVLAGMGQALASISGQFTRDYQRLIAQMQRVLERRPEPAE